MDDLPDMCPICKTDKYLSPSMTFLINPECYHKICESCVDRIFSLGPAPCPYPKCGKILRKNKFKQQVFGDLKIEKEIDVRRKVGGIYNKTQEDFATLEEYNQYLELVEEIVFKLSNGIEVEKTEQDLAQYEQEHKIEILEKNMRESQRTANLTKYQDAMERLKQEKLKIQRKMEMEDLEFKKLQQQELLDRMSNSDMSSAELIQHHQMQLNKRNSLRKKQLQQITNKLDQQFIPKQSEPNNSIPFTPFEGDRASPMYNTEEYHDPYIFELSSKKEYLAAGWRLELVFQRALDEAFCGIGCHVEAEKKLVTV
ncbi:TFB3 [Candida oxycetoniae]|uniref:RNA polymerase II transcription factor B subunit 3 n=1 Tax=Candida oxycetoniae TaxID=497107 RepID=A0AAI9WY97_9ASCO|nr:TFB3 [Candida oxycetoniae]KAI3404908.1 TFB3 [Candida oxycetoniae]